MSKVIQTKCIQTVLGIMGEVESYRLTLPIPRDVPIPPYAAQYIKYYGSRVFYIRESKDHTKIMHWLKRAQLYVTKHKILLLKQRERSLIYQLNEML